MAGLGRMSGILYVAFIDIFHVNRLQASVPFSARSLARNLFGPVVGIIGQKYGVRTTTLVGGIVGTLSAVFCFCTQSILWITILWGVFNGAGAALTMTIPQVVLNQHFKKYRTTASGMAFSGCCVGSFLFPVLLEYLLKTYGLTGSFLILGGIIMNVIPAAMVLRKPSWLKKESKIVISKNVKNTESHVDDRKIRNEFYQNEKGHAIKNKEKNEESENAMDIPELKGYDNPNLILNSSKFLRDNSDLFIKLLKSLKSFAIADDDKALLASSEDMQRNYFEYLCTLLDNNIKERCPLRAIIKKDSSDTCATYTDKYIKRDCKNAEIEIVLSARNLKMPSLEEFYNSLSERIQTLIHKDLKSIQPLFSDEEWVKVSLLIEQMKHIFKDLNVNRTDTFENTTGNDNNICHKENDDKRPNTFKAHISTAIKLHKNPLFLLISFSRSVHFLTFVPAMTIIVDFSMDKGLLEEDGKYVIAAISFGDLMGRLCLGWITDKEYLSLPRYMFLVMVMQGACTAALSLMYSKLTLLSAITLFGLLQGSLFVRHPVLVSKYLDSHEQSVAMGCFNFFSGLLGFSLPNYIGYFRDTVGSYDYIFYINGAIGTTVGIMWFFEPYLLKCVSSSEESIQESL